MRRTQILSHNKNIHGGISGSFPLDGHYGAYEILSWATKFYVDLLFVEEILSGNEKDGILDSC